ncbi:MAG: A/G-specific adenine glycosylase [Candidatus Omnitrophica bacterium]|nr:A/G-specific adenine glycosylase [Candidatus Omnitrophota bacterium]
MQNIKNFSKNLISWYSKNKRDLPWRKTTDSYKIWISEIMLQQTTVNAVIPYYKAWIKKFPTMRSVANAPLQKILKQWQGLGYYSRARNIHKTAKIILKNHKGKLPCCAKDLLKLPGFGPYTTGAVLSIAFDARYPIVDANVRRVIMRQLALEGYADTSQDKKILEFLEKALPQKDLSSFNQGLMELGALICRTDNALCTMCPVKETCCAYQKGTQEIIPKPKKKVIQKIDAVVGVIKNKNSFFIQKRNNKGLLADLWEFPGGKIEKNETPKQALKRELKEEIGVNLVSAKKMINLKHFYTQFSVNLHVLDCEVSPLPKIDKTHRWVSLKNIYNYPMPSGSSKILDYIIKIRKDIE